MELNEHTKVKVINRPELGSGEVLRVEERHGEYLVDVVFEKDGKRVLETFPRNFLEPVPNLLQRYQKGESDHPLDFFLKQLAYQFPLKTQVASSPIAGLTSSPTKSS